MSDRLLNVNEVAEILHLKSARIYELSRAGKLPFLVRIGERQYRYSQFGLQKWIERGGNNEFGQAIEPGSENHNNDISN